MKQLHYWSLTDLAARLRQREVSPVEVTRALLDRIDALEPRLHSYVTIMRESALAAAQRAEAEIRRGSYRGPLHGVPIAVKDILFTEDAPTGAGSGFLGDINPRRDATAIAALRRAGAILTGKLAMTEGALAEHHPSRPAPVNPWNPAFWTGVSSSGSGVATAAGLCFGSLGTDTGGSIRMPSAACGIVGLKPTWGRISRHGLFPLCESRDHIGPMTRTVADAAALLTPLAFHDPEDPTSLSAPGTDYLAGIDHGVGGLRLGIDRQWITAGVDPVLTEALTAAAEVFKALGARLHEIAYPSPQAYLDLYFPSTVAEASLAHAATFPARAAEYGPGLRALLEAAPRFGCRDVAEAERAKLRFNGALAFLFEEIDVVVMPVMPFPTKTTAEMAAMLDPGTMIRQHGRFTIPINAAGYPSLVLPCGFGAGGMPMAMQLVAKPLAEALLLRAGYAYQTATDWHTRHPDLD